MEDEIDYEDLGLILTPEQLAVLEADDGAESAGDTDADGKKHLMRKMPPMRPTAGNLKLRKVMPMPGKTGRTAVCRTMMRTRSFVPRTANTRSLMKSW
ncbi:TPA: hypothetical protein WH761_000430 [Neisseria meningitidis]